VIEAELRELKILCEYSNSYLSVEELIGMKWTIDSRIRQVFSEEVVELVESIK
jgi:hypothetical protein